MYNLEYVLYFEKYASNILTHQRSYLRRNFHQFPFLTLTGKIRKPQQ